MQYYARQMAVSLFNLEWSPPGRGLWAMGTQMIYERGAMALYNCFHGNTRIVTKKGLQAFKDIVDEDVEVLTHDGQWRTAHVNAHGKQAVQRITLKPAIGNGGQYRIEYVATDNHEWILSDGSRTTNLKTRDHITIRPYKPSYTDEYREGFAHGFVFGDGSRVGTVENQYQLPLCSNKDKLFQEQLELASSYDRTNATSYEWPILYFKITGLDDWKTIPNNGKSRSYNHGFLEGVIAADGHQSNPDYLCVDNTSTQLRNWIFSNAPLLGYVVTGCSEDNRDTNYGQRRKPIQRIKLRRECVEFMVESIIPAGYTDVYCVREPVTSSFMLEYGVVTGNCAFTEIGDNWISDLHWLMDAMMYGVGVGFSPVRDNNLTLPHPVQGHETYDVPDSREGWCDSVSHLLDCIRLGVPYPIFDYSHVRPEGAPLRTFGGTASGPAPLVQLHERILMICEMFAAGRMDSVQFKTDLANCVGCCVVAGNIRRGAEIALAPISDPTFLHLKN